MNLGEAGVIHIGKAQRLKVLKAPLRRFLELRKWPPSGMGLVKPMGAPPSSHSAMERSGSCIIVASARKKACFQGAAGCEASASEAVKPTASAAKRRASMIELSGGGCLRGAGPPAKCMS